MEKLNRQQTSKSGRPSKYPISLTVAANALGVTKSHLDKVLQGQRMSRRLSAKYAALLHLHRLNPAVK